MIRARRKHARPIVGDRYFTVSEEIERAEARLRVRQATRDRALLAGQDLSDAHLQGMYAEQQHLKELREKRDAQLPVYTTRADRRRARQ